MSRMGGYGTTIELTCDYCGKKWVVKYGLRKRRFCSNKCRGKAQYEEQKDTNSFYNNNISWIRGKTFEEVYGEEKAMNLKENLRSSKLGDKNPSKRKDVKDKISATFKKKRENGWVSPLKGRTHTEEQNKETSRTTKIAMNRPEVREKIKNANVGEKLKKWHSIPENKRKFLEIFNNSETREKMRKSHVLALSSGKYKNKKDTGIEKFVESILIENGFVENKDYFKQVPFPEDKPRYALDFYLPVYRLNIEAMGCWWHKCEECGYGPKRERDKKRVDFITKRGINVYNIWEHQMKNYKAEDFKSFLINFYIPSYF